MIKEICTHIRMYVYEYKQIKRKYVSINKRRIGLITIQDKFPLSYIQRG